MKKCEYCERPIIGRRITARFCSDFCRLRAFRDKNGSKYQKRKEPLKMVKNVKSYTCCENAHFYSPVGRWGELLIIDDKVIHAAIGGNKKAMEEIKIYLQNWAHEHGTGHAEIEANRIGLEVAATSTQDEFKEFKRTLRSCLK